MLHYIWICELDNYATGNCAIVSVPDTIPYFIDQMPSPYSHCLRVVTFACCCMQHAHIG